MVLNIGNSGVYNNQGVESTSNQIQQGLNTKPDSSSQAGVELLKNMLAGDIFTGEVTGMNGSEVTLKFSNGMDFTATLLENTNISFGQNITFMVNENLGDKISIKPMFASEQENIVIGKALDAAGIPFSERSINVVKELLTQNMPIDKDTINEMIKTSARFPDANIDTLARMTKLDIPITQENIQQFEAYKSYEHSISGELKAMGDSLGDLISQIVSEGGTKQAANTAQNILDILYSQTQSGENTAADNSFNNANNTYENISKFSGEGERGQLAGKLTESLTNATGEVSPEVTNLANQIKSGDISARYVLQNINELIKSGQSFDADKIKDMFESKEFTALIKQTIRDNMRITPDDVKSEDAIKEFYKRVREDISRLSEEIGKAGKDTQFGKSLETVKNNIDFMNDLNKNMTYFQMPIKFSSSDANGELYVFTNKKKLAQKGDDVSALLHLDMDNLGSMDIYVKLAGKNVSTNFCLESEEMLDFIYDHIDQLNSRLESLGYTMSFEMKVSSKEESGVDFVEEFLDRDMPLMGARTQLIFDTKA